MATDFSISLDMPSVDDLIRVINGATFPLAAQAVRAIANQAQFRWKDSVNRANIWSGEKTPYIQSIKIRYLDDLHAEVFSDYKYAQEIEEGRPPRDLKMMLDTSPKVRRTKEGKRFLVIPMRTNTPGNTALAPAMPTSVYELAKEMIPSEVMGQGERPAGELTNLSPTGGMSASSAQTPFMSNAKTKSAFMVVKNNYAWGGRMSRGAMAAAGISKQDQKRFAGMVRMKESTGGSVFLNFRIMMDGQAGWVTKPKPGLHLVANVVEQLQPLATAAIGEAMRRMSET